MLNPISYTEQVVDDFLRYQLTTYSLADADLHGRLRELVSLERTRSSPLLKGPYISLSRSFRKGSSFKDLGDEGILHPHIARLSGFSHAYGHQETAFRSIRNGRTTLISTGTGSGKTECFLYPIISRCLELRDEGAASGITAVLVYPMNALAEDQVSRLRDLLAGTGVTFGMYVGKTAEQPDGVAGYRLSAGASREDYRARLEQLREARESAAVYPAEELPSRVEMRESPPRILLTNVKQLELLLTRHRDVELFDGARLEYLVFDEAHTFSGSGGAETSALIRRLREFCGKSARETICVATSATIADPERGEEAGREFASRFFGVDPRPVALVGEEYEDDLWAPRRRVPQSPTDNAGEHLEEILEALSNLDEVGDESSASPLLDAYYGFTQRTLPSKGWAEKLYQELSENELVFWVAEALRRPSPLGELSADLSEQLGRNVSEQEILCWLALGAASRKEGRPLLRPVVHAFIRGVGGAVVTFPHNLQRPRLWLSAEDAAQEDEGLTQLPLTTCTTCGQHYFIHSVKDFQFFEAAPGGGDAEGDLTVWPALEVQLGGSRVVLIDKLVTAADQGDDEDEEAPHDKTAPVHLCRECGALHSTGGAACASCGAETPKVELYAVRQKEDSPGRLTSCLACSAIGHRRYGRYYEPAKEIRASTAADVHVLAQSLIQWAQRKRLLVFADNRQDAAFQAGWMQDRARRYRLRALMYDRIAESAVSVGDLTAHLNRLLDEDDDLSRVLIPEVWRVARKERAGQEHGRERKAFLRIQVLREVTTPATHRIGLEPWGRMVVQYDGLQPDLTFFERWTDAFSCSPEELRDGVANLLDYIRRKRMLYDRDGEIYNIYWHEGDRLVQQGYLPHQPGGPTGEKLRRGLGDNKSWVHQWISERGDTVARQMVRNWGLDSEDVPVFLEELWEIVTADLRLLVPVTLKGSRGGALPGTTGVYQIDADRLILEPHRGVFECDTCRRSFPRTTPHDVCPAWRCGGTLRQKEESPENYDLMVLDRGFDMIRPREHSAQIPAADREILERAFKGEGELINTLVATPTLELGVDIGALDSVLMRNVPPLPANYWQRVGRAGRRHRMAVNFCYARAASHDRAYFRDPLRLLEGLIRPPSFNLNNDVLVRKHVHAAVLTVLHQQARDDSSLSSHDRDEIRSCLGEMFPSQVRGYLFEEDGTVRLEKFDAAPLRTVVSKHQQALMDHVQGVFEQGWPGEAADLVTEAALRQTIEEMADHLEEVVGHLEQRLAWARNQIERLEELRRKAGTLGPEEDALWHRCDRLIKKLKGIRRRSRREAEGFDETNTYAVLAAEGFLPGYGLDTGWVVGYHLAPRFGSGIRDWEVRRNAALAIREYVPGNVIYANRHRFIPRTFRLEGDEPLHFAVDPGAEAIHEVGRQPEDETGSIGTLIMPAVPVCDVDLPHHSHISEEEEYRFRLPVAVYGHEQHRHDGGREFKWGSKALKHRDGVHLRLVNVGPTSRVEGSSSLGYPVCLVCGQSRSPYASDAELDRFREYHLDVCGRQVEDVGFYADVVADSLRLDSAQDRAEGFSVMEALRRGAAEVLEMEDEDLQLLSVGHPGEERVDILLYDPMPGGSGLLEQIVERWDEVIGAALEIVADCPQECESACVDCLLQFRNAHYHRYLNRHTARERLEQWGQTLTFSHDIPPELPDQPDAGQPVNEAEQTLKVMLDQAGFSGYRAQHQIKLGRPWGSTTPDFFFEDPADRYEGICIYLDGLSEHIHGNPETRQRDRQIRERLRNDFFEVVEVAATDLNDAGAMQRHFYRLGRLLLGKEEAEKIRDSASWAE